MKTLFYISIFLVAYTYLGYPLVLWVLTKRSSTNVLRRPITPPVSIIIAARNEADKIRLKIEHTLALDYPDDRLEILVASDASDDGTDEIVEEYCGRSVRLVRAARRQGKEYVQGLAAAVAKGDLLLFTDAATVLEPHALERLVRNFADPAIGAVSTEDVLVDTTGNPTAEGAYVKYEMWVRRLESRFHSLVGLSGSCFAIRKDLCSDWSPTLASDFMGALHAVRRGYRSIADPSVRGRFVAVTSARAEVRRKIRTFLRGITVVVANLDLLNPVRYGRFAFQFASHKLLRFCAPFLLLTALTTSGLLSADPVFKVLFSVQAGFYFMGCASAVLSPPQRYRFLRVPCYFTMVQWAMMMAWGKFLSGHREVAWEPSKRGPARAMMRQPRGKAEAVPSRAGHPSFLVVRAAIRFQRRLRDRIARNPILRDGP